MELELRASELIVYKVVNEVLEDLFESALVRDKHRQVYKLNQTTRQRKFQGALMTFSDEVMAAQFAYLNCDGDNRNLRILCCRGVRGKKAEIFELWSGIVVRKRHLPIPVGTIFCKELTPVSVLSGRWPEKKKTT